jgi:hypothetical protein
VKASNTLTCTANGIVTIPSGEYFDVGVTTTPTSVGSLTNPTGAGICKVDPVGANGVISEGNESNNTCTETVTVTVNPSPDLSAVKTNNVGGTVLAGTSFNWSIQVLNANGAGTATFASGYDLLTDNLPTGPTYGTVTVTTAGGTTGTVSCSILVTTLTCSASGGNVVIPANGSFTATFSVLETSVGTLINPASGSGNICAADPDNRISEDDEANNSCADTVEVTAAPACGQNLVTWSFENVALGSNTSPTYSFIASDVNAANTITATGAGLSGATIANNGNPGHDWEATSFATPNALDTANNDYFEFSVDTTHYTGINLSYDFVRDANGPARVRVYYSANGSTWVNSLTAARTIVTSYATFTEDLSAYTALNNQTRVYFRVYGYRAGALSGIGRIDNFSVLGCKVPEPPSISKLFSPHTIPAGTNADIHNNKSKSIYYFKWCRIY